MSTDGKYFLGKKILYGKETLVIVDVNARKFEYLLGRDYLKHKLFYSPGFKKFALDMDESIIYLEYPKTFRFGSFGPDAEIKRSTTKEDKISGVNS
jgi:hypothetical protein